MDGKGGSEWFFYMVSWGALYLVKGPSKKKRPTRTGSDISPAGCLF